MPDSPALAIWCVGGGLLAPLLVAVFGALVMLLREMRRQGDLTRGVLSAMREDLRKTRGAAERAETSASGTGAVLRDIRDGAPRAPASQRDGLRTVARVAAITLPSGTTTDPDAAPSRPSRPSRPTNGEF